MDDTTRLASVVSFLRTFRFVLDLDQDLSTGTIFSVFCDGAATQRELVVHTLSKMLFMLLKRKRPIGDTLWQKSLRKALEERQEQYVGPPEYSEIWPDNVDFWNLEAHNKIVLVWNLCDWLAGENPKMLEQVAVTTTIRRKEGPKLLVKTKDMMARCVSVGKTMGKRYWYFDQALSDPCYWVFRSNGGPVEIVSKSFSEFEGLEKELGPESLFVKECIPLIQKKRRRLWVQQEVLERHNKWRQTRPRRKAMRTDSSQESDSESGEKEIDENAMDTDEEYYSSDESTVWSSDAEGNPEKEDSKGFNSSSNSQNDQLIDEAKNKESGTASSHEEND